MFEQELDSFESDEVITEAPSVTDADIAADPTKDTFDNGVYKEEVDKDSQVSSLDDNEDKDEDQPSKQDEKKEEKEDPKEEKEGIEEKEDGEKKEEPKVQGKAIKVKTADGNSIDIPEDGTVKVKVKGKNEFVSLQELRNNYSGQKAWTEEIETAKSKQQEAEQRLSNFQSEKQELAGHLQKIGNMLDDPEHNPLEALNYLLDITGRDVNNYSKRIFDYMEDQVGQMSTMDEVERENYWLKREQESYRNNQAAKAEQQKQEQAQRELLQRVDQLRESQGVSEDQFVEAHDELTKLGFSPDKITPEFAVEYATMKPFVEKAEGITSDYKDDLGDSDLDSLTSEVAKVLKRRPDISPEDALTISARILGFEVESVDDYVDQLNSKVSGRPSTQPPAQKVAAKEDPNHLESFEDFDY